MAEGKYLLALAALYRTGLCVANRYRKWVNDAVIRLERSALKPSTGGVAWGLNFPYRDASADQPYCITTSIVVDALMDSYELLDDKEVLELLLRSGLVWLQTGLERQNIRWRDRTCDVPLYVPGEKRLVLNSIAYWVGVMARAQSLGLLEREDDLAEIGDWLLDNYISGAGWPYEFAAARIDLVHQCYILNGLTRILPIPAIEWKAIETLSRFACFEGLIDKFDAHTPVEGLYVAQRASAVLVRFYPALALAFSQVPARPWSFGEFLTVVAHFACSGTVKSYWHNVLVRQGRLIPGYMQDLDTHGGTPLNPRFRETMHVAHGLCRLLEALRHRGSGNL